MTDTNTTSTEASSSEQEQAGTRGRDRRDDHDRRTAVRERYGEIAADEGTGDDRERNVEDDGEDCCSPACCDDDREATPVPPDADAQSLELGYEPDDLEDAPDGANLGLGCGNPVAISNLEPGETVLDLGSGGGFDCFLAAREVAPGGRVIGVDMTPSMLKRARENATETDQDLEDVDLEFRLGEIEHLPVADGAVDAIISNCVVNLSPDKPQVLSEAFRTLRSGGRLSISDLVATEPLPAAVREDPDLVSACVGGAATIEEMEGWLEAAGFREVSITVEGEWGGEYDGEELPIVSARIEARKPETVDD
ncbi:arsenite methyltransferase [Halobacteria archaeon AArc-m2/3/4]|uniref:Arsenite methyltransferase n=1 Tax=Natronoglomus mannanivorans TaxID=2979990 RepID=A0ABT2QKU3_9EURY|nr:arsenite methyltransferase [Halobacteria archaeon AArc-m2/3/4]